MDTIKNTKDIESYLQNIFNKIAELPIAVPALNASTPLDGYNELSDSLKVETLASLQKQINNAQDFNDSYDAKVPHVARCPYGANLPQLYKVFDTFAMRVEASKQSDIAVKAIVGLAEQIVDTERKVYRYNTIHSPD